MYNKSDYNNNNNFLAFCLIDFQKFSKSVPPWKTSGSALLLLEGIIEQPTKLTRLKTLIKARNNPNFLENQHANINTLVHRYRRNRKLNLGIFTRKHLFNAAQNIF